MQSIESKRESATPSCKRSHFNDLHSKSTQQGRSRVPRLHEQQQLPCAHTAAENDAAASEQNSGAEKTDVIRSRLHQWSSLHCSLLLLLGLLAGDGCASSAQWFSLARASADQQVQ